MGIKHRPQVQLVRCSGRVAADTGSHIGAELSPVDVAPIPDGLEHRTMRRLCDTQVAHYGSVVRQAVAHRERPENSILLSVDQRAQCVAASMGGDIDNLRKIKQLQEIENSGIDRAGWAVEVNVQAATKQEPTSECNALGTQRIHTGKWYEKARSLCWERVDTHRKGGQAEGQ